MPPAACIADAAVITARMISIALIGGSPGCSCRTKAKKTTPARTPQSQPDAAHPHAEEDEYKDGHQLED